MAKKREGAWKHKGLKIWAGAIGAAFLAATAVYIVMLQVERKMLEGYERTEVYFAAEDIPAGTFFTQETMGQYLVKAEMDIQHVPETALKSPEQAMDKVVLSKIDKGVPVTEGMLQSVDEITIGMEQPVVAGFRGEDLFQVVGGVLRAGDRIHIYRREEEGTFLTWENVYVQQVFDSSGVVIGSGDRETCAQRINIFLDKKDVERFYAGLDQGNLRVVKVWK